MFDAIAFAGGGNRCYWQGGFWAAAAEGARSGAEAGGRRQRRRLAGGLFAARPLSSRVRPTVVGACGPHRLNFDWRRRTSPAWFPVAPLFHELVSMTLGEAEFARLNALTDLRIAIARPPRWLPAQAAPWLALSAYQLEKRLFHPVHPRFGRALGFEPEFLSIRAMAQPRPS